MSYGFDPSELIETKIDLIDKDGFHGVGTADGGENSGNATGSGLKEGIYIYYTTRYITPDSDGVNVMVILTKENHPELFEDITKVSNDRCEFYFGDDLDQSKFFYYDEGIFYGDQYESDKTIGLSEYSGGGFLGSEIYYEVGTGGINTNGWDQTPDGTPFHAVLSFIVDGEATRIEFVDSVWHINGMPE